jgi:hypothetical protein
MQRVNYCSPCAIGGRSLSPWIVFLPTCSPPLSTSAIEASAMAISAPRAVPRLMQPTVTANSGLAGYRPPPKTIVKYADAPWEPPNSSASDTGRGRASACDPKAQRHGGAERKKQRSKRGGQPLDKRALLEATKSVLGLCFVPFVRFSPLVHAMTDFDCRTRMAGMRPFVLSAEIASAYSQH